MKSFGYGREIETAMKKEIFLASMLLMAGCGNAEEINPFTDFPRVISSQPELSPALTTAIKFWNDGLQFEAFTIGDGPIVVLTNPHPPGGQGGNTHCDNAGECVIRIYEPLANDWPLVAHEMGHSLGLRHSKDPDCIMYPHAGENQAVTPEIMEALQ